MTTKHRFSETNAISPAGTWVAMSGYRQFAALATLAAADDGEGISIQLRKATSAAGADADDHGDPVAIASAEADIDLSLMASAYAADLGETAGGVAFTHVTAVVSRTGSPASTEELSGIVVRCDGRFSE